MSLKQQITDDMKTALREGDKRRLGVIRMALAAIKQKEVDERIDSLDDAQVIAVIEKMIKQRRDSVSQYQKGGRDDLVAQEQYEIEVLTPYLPEQLSDDEIEALIDEAIAATGAASMKDMGRVMGMLKPKLAGRADMGAVSARIKARLG